MGELELRNKVKEAVKAYYKEVFGEKRTFDYIPPSGKLLGEEELMNMIDVIWKERITVNHNKEEWLLNRIDKYDDDMKRAYECQS